MHADIPVNPSTVKKISSYTLTRLYQREYVLIKALVSCVALSGLFGCAHPISIAASPAAGMTDSASGIKRPEKIAYYISTESLNLEVTTPGGGGDNVRYFPYRDMEDGYRKMLANTFFAAIRVSSVSDKNELSRGGISYLLMPELVTSSGSTGLFTWPPTNFSIDLTTKVQDSAGKEVGNYRVLGVGKSDGYSDFKDNYGIAGQRAMDDALAKTRLAILEKLGTPSSNASGSPAASDRLTTTKARLDALRELLEKKIITLEEFNLKRKQIIETL